MKTRVVALFAVLLAACGGEFGQELEVLDSNLEFEAAISGLSASARHDLARARAATAKYHDTSVAIAEGYAPLGVCADGGPLLNFGLLDPFVDPERPEIIITVARPDGSQRMIAVNYVAIALVDGQPYFGATPPQGLTAPVLFDQPMQLHRPSPDMPWVWDLHAFIWVHNPAGMFAPYHPGFSC